MDRKLKVYLDTSVISYLHQEDAPERMGGIRLYYWEVGNNGIYIGDQSKFYD